MSKRQHRLITPRGPIQDRHEFAPHADHARFCSTCGRDPLHRIHQTPQEALTAHAEAMVAAGEADSLTDALEALQRALTTPIRSTDP